MRIILKYLFFTCIIFAAISAKAQHAAFLKEGNITFEKQVNILAIMKENNRGDDDNIWGQKAIEAYENSGKSPFISSSFNLAFNGPKTLYTPLDEEIKASGFAFIQSAASNNVVYTDFDSSKSVAAKTIFDDNIQLIDSTRQIHWKITDETREIAGFQCRRANALVMDSIYAVAFYTDAIITPGGPESFSGLPGMILGLALPHLHITWFAQKVSASPQVDKSALVPPVPRRRAVTVNRKGLYDRLNKSLKEWGKSGNTIMVNALL